MNYFKDKLPQENSHWSGT